MLLKSLSEISKIIYLQIFGVVAQLVRAQDS